MKVKEKKRATLFDAIIPIVCLMLFLGISIFKYDASPHIPLIGGTLVAGLVATFKLGYKWNELEESIFNSIKMAMQAILIIMIVGVIIGTWIISGIVPSMIYWGLEILSPKIFIFNSIKMAMQAILIIMIVGVIIGTWIISGIVPSMIYWGLEILSPKIFLVATTLICAIVSIATGSSWTTMGTVGVALLGIGQGIGMPAPLVAGAIISGAYFGDKLSPLSDTTNLAPAMAGTNLFDHIKFMLYSTVPSLIICLILYGFIGMRYASTDLDFSQIVLIRETLLSSFNTLSPVLFLPPIIVIVLVVCKVPAIPGLITGAVLGFIFAITFQGANIGDILNAAYSGFVSDSGVAMVDELLSKGGLMSMMSTVSLTVIALSLGGILERTGMLEALASSILRFAKGTFGIVFATMATCVMTNAVAGEQYLSVVIPGRMYKEEYTKRNLHPKMLSRALEDSGTMSSALIPWNTCGAYIYGTLGVSTFAYFPFAFLNPKMLSRALEDSGTMSSALIPWNTCGAYIYGTLGVSTFAYFPFAFLNLINPLISLFLIAINFKVATLTPQEKTKLEQGEVLA